MLVCFFSFVTFTSMSSAGVLADDHALVDGRARLDEDFSPLLQVPDRIGGCGAGAIRDQHAGHARLDRAVPWLPPGEQVVHDPGALGLGQELRTEPDQPRAGMRNSIRIRPLP